MKEFDDRPLVAGSIRGLRTFRVTDAGVLTGVTQRHCEFKPGLNDAICLGPDMFAMNQVLRRAFGLLPKESDDHQIAGLKCGCGFYAYFDGSNDYRPLMLLEEAADPGHVAGLAAIIEGSGVLTAGSRGFRASKAELVALVDHYVPELPAPKWARRVAAMDATLALVNAGFLALSISRGAAWWALAVQVAATLICGGLAFDQMRRRLRWRRRVDPARALIERVKANYPGVPWYASETEALAAHPLTPPPPVEVKKTGGVMTGGRSRKCVRADLPAMVALLHDRPELRDAMPFADALDMAARWNA